MQQFEADPGKTAKAKCLFTGIYVLYAIVYVHSLFFPSLITMFETFPCVLIHSVITSIQHDLKPATTKA